MRKTSGERERRDSDAHIATWNGKMKGKCKMQERRKERNSCRGEWVNPAGPRRKKKERGELSIKELEGLAGGPAFYIYIYIYITKVFAIESRRNRGSQFAQRVIPTFTLADRSCCCFLLFYLILFYFYSGLDSNRWKLKEKDLTGGYLHFINVNWASGNFFASQKI
jgi:hypothetical protein